jgi:hypothetical protein
MITVADLLYDLGEIKRQLRLALLERGIPVRNEEPFSSYPGFIRDILGEVRHIPMPVPTFNVLNDDRHALIRGPVITEITDIIRTLYIPLTMAPKTPSFINPGDALFQNTQTGAAQTYDDKLKALTISGGYTGTGITFAEIISEFEAEVEI